MSDPPNSFGTPDDRFTPASFTPPPPPGAPPPEAPPPAGPPPPPSTSGIKDGVMRGFLLGLLAHTLQVILGALTSGISIFAIGLSQLIYMLPLYIYMKRQGLLLTAKGFLICMGITFLLNTACVGILIIALSNADFR
jgi:hypothetical protein